MRVFYLLFTSIFFTQIYSQEINWMTFEEALEAQKKIPKKIFMNLYADWCGPCKIMDKKTFKHRDVANYINKYFYAVKFNAEGDKKINFFDREFTNPNYDKNRKGRNSTHQLTLFLRVEGYPSIVFLSEDGDPMLPIMGYHNPQQLEFYLKLIKQGDYSVFRSPEDFEKYQKYFRPKFKG